MNELAACVEKLKILWRFLTDEKQNAEIKTLLRKWKQTNSVSWGRNYLPRMKNKLFDRVTTSSSGELLLDLYTLPDCSWLRTAEREKVLFSQLLEKVSNFFINGDAYHLNRGILSWFLRKVIYQIIFHVHSLSLNTRT